MKPTNPKSSDLVLSVQGVSKAFDGFKAIDDLRFYLGEGELRTVIGPNGAGKSTFMDLITGRTRPDEGTILFHHDDGRDVDLTRMKEYQVNRLGIARKFQTPSVYANHTVFDNLLLSLDRSRSLVRALFYKPSAEDLEEIDEVLKTIRLTERREIGRAHV